MNKHGLFNGLNQLQILMNGVEISGDFIYHCKSQMTSYAVSLNNVASPLQSVRFSASWQSMEHELRIAL